VLQGEHDVSTAESLLRELDEAGDSASLVVDLTNVDFLDSSIVKTLLEARERALSKNAAIALVAPPGSFASRVLALAAPTVIPTYSAQAEAVASVSVAD